VLLTARRYAEIEEDLTRLDELELLEMINRAEADIAKSRTISHQQVQSEIRAKKNGFREPQKARPLRSSSMIEIEWTAFSVWPARSIARLFSV